MTQAITVIPQIPANLPALTEVFYDSMVRGIDSWERIPMIGRNNIATLISSARSKEKSLTGSIGRLVEEIKLLTGKSGEDFVKLALEYENPQDMQVAIPKDSWSHDPEPTDHKSINRKGDATTFNICGWCKHTGGGTCRYSFHISTSCGLYGEGSPETKFNTHCLFQSMTAEQVSEIVAKKGREIESLKDQRQGVRNAIRTLQGMGKGATDKPWLMQLRPHDLFNVGDEVAANMANYQNKTVEGEWVRGFVIFGYRHHDGCVSYQTEFPVHSNMEYFEGRGGGAGMGRPELLLMKELLYLHQAASGSDPAFFEIWMGNVSTHLEGFDKERFVHDVVYGKFAVPPENWTPPTESFEIKSKKDAERVLQCLDADLFKNEDEIKGWARMQLRYVHPDKLSTVQNEAVKAYAERQTKAVYAARDFLIERLRNKK